MGTLLLILFIGAFGFFGYLFVINGFDINKTKRYFQVNFMKCCIKDEKEIEEKIGVEAVKKLKGDLVDIEDCKEPLPTIPLDLCLSSDLEIEELKIREKIFNQLKERENFIVDGGMNKMILPLEATIFLTKNFNPLVSEEGNILVISEHSKISSSTEFEEIRLYLKDNDIKNDRGELIYKDDKSILDLIKANINAEVSKKTEDRRSVKRFNAEEAIDKDILANETNNEENIFEEAPTEDDIFSQIDKELKSDSKKENNDIFADIDKELSSETTKKEDKKSNNDIFADIDKELSSESKKEEPKKSNKDIFADIDKELSSEPKKEEHKKSNKDIFADIDKELSSEPKKEEPKKKEEKKDIFADIDKELSSESKKEEPKKENTSTEEPEFSIEGNPFDDEEEIDFSKLDEEISLNMNDLEFEEDETEDENENMREAFFKKIKYKRLSVKNLNKETLADDIKDIFKNNEMKEAILNNLIKTTPIIFNPNKEVVFIDMKNIFFAIAKVYGIDSNKKIELFDRLDIPTVSKISKIIASEFEDEISDLISGNKNLNRVVLERDNEYYYSFGLYFMSDVFKKVLSDEDFDFFRQYPYNTEYKITDGSNKTNTPLIPSLKNSEI